MTKAKEQIEDNDEFSGLAAGTTGWASAFIPSPSPFLGLAQLNGR